MSHSLHHNLLEVIHERIGSLNKSERKVAEVIIIDPQAATRYSIASLARAAGVSEPTVNRFCRNFSTSGFPDFKIQLAQSLASSGTPYVSQSVSMDDSPRDYTDKIFLTTIAGLDRARQSIDISTITEAVDYLIQAKQIAFFGSGGSAPVALDAQHKFFRFNIPVTAYDDALMQRMVAAAATTGDVIVAISYTGRTRETVEAARLARANGATVIGITSPDSPWLAPARPPSRSAALKTPIFICRWPRASFIWRLSIYWPPVSRSSGVPISRHTSRKSRKVSRRPVTRTNSSGSQGRIRA